jgi:hypothetical protein
MIYAISIPVWVSAAIALLVGTVGTFNGNVTGTKKMLALAHLPASSGLFWIACRMCGLL